MTADTRPARAWAWSGIAAPASFVGGWVVAGLRTPGYDATRQAISQLAAVGAGTRPLMTAGFVGFGVFALPWAAVLSGRLGDRRLLGSVGLAGVSTLAVAALPLGGPLGDGAHAAAAALGYVGMAATPALAAGHLGPSGRRASYAVSTVSAVCLLATVAGEHSGAFQRLGLGAVDVWFVVMASRILQEPRRA